MKHYAKLKHMVGEGNRICNKGILEVLGSIENIKVGTKINLSPKILAGVIDLKMVAVEVDKDKVVWEID